MSLINKMLQDLDARGSQPGQGMPMDIKSVIHDERRIGLPIVIGGLVALVLLGAGSWYGWRYFKRPAPAPAPVTAAAPAGVTVVAPPAASAPLAVAAAAPAPLAATVAQVPAAAPQASEPAPAPVVTTTRPRIAAKPASGNTRKVAAGSAAPANVTAAAAAKPAPEASGEGRQSSGQHRAEGEYRRALAALAEGRISEALSGLEQAIQIEPRHEAARQTLVGLLIEARRKDEAMRLLQTGLALDARQPSMAMLLARMQVEGGGPAIDTLMRTLPYAAGNGEYHAFLGGVLQRENRHREAAEQYQAALRVVPGNGVWWMGLGISEQAEKRQAEAVGAFERARDSGSLTPQLLAFVERKLQLLGK